MKHFLSLVFLFFLTAACSQASLSTPTPLPFLTQIPFSTATFTEPSSPTPTSTPSPTPTPPHPLSIEYLRVQSYNADQLYITRTYPPYWNYERHIASYYSEGLRLDGYLTIPRGEMPETGWPVIIFNHGWIQPEYYQSTERYVAYVDTFASHGYIVYRPDYRGHADSEGIARGAYGTPDYTIDVLNAVAAIKTFSDADPERIGMWGHSLGGYITLRAMVVDGDIKAGVIWGGVVAPYEDIFNLWWFANTTPTPNANGEIVHRGWRGRLYEAYGSPEENPDFWTSISANSFLEDLSGPIQLHHATTDETVPYVLSEILYEQILDVGGIVELYAYPGDDHNIANGFSLAMQRSLNFFDLYVKGE